MAGGSIYATAVHLVSAKVRKIGQIEPGMARLCGGIQILVRTLTGEMFTLDAKVSDSHADVRPDASAVPRAFSILQRCSKIWRSDFASSSHSTSGPNSR